MFEVDDDNNNELSMRIFWPTNEHSAYINVLSIVNYTNLRGGFRYFGILTKLYYNNRNKIFNEFGWISVAKP